MIVNTVHWLIGAGLLNYKGQPFKAVVKRAAHRSGRDIKRDKKRIIGLIKDKTVMGIKLYADLKKEGYLTTSNGHLSYSRFASMCVEIKKREMGMDVETRTNKVLRLIKAGKSRGEVMAELNLTSPQMSSSTRSLRIRGDITC